MLFQVLGAVDTVIVPSPTKTERTSAVRHPANVTGGGEGTRRTRAAASILPQSARSAGKGIEKPSFWDFRVAKAATIWTSTDPGGRGDEKILIIS